jgi:hypothetical protein
MALLADLTNLNKFSFVFDPDSIFAVNVMFDPAGSKTTFVWKIADVAQAVADTPAAFLNRHGLTAHFAQLTGPDGELWVRAEDVSVLHMPFPGDGTPPSVRCMLSVGGSPFTALEDVQTVRERIDAIRTKQDAARV